MMKKILFIITIMLFSYNSMAQGKFRLKETGAIGVAFVKLKTKSISSVELGIENVKYGKGVSVKVCLLEDAEGVEPNKMYHADQYTILDCKEIENIKEGINSIPFNLTWSNSEAVIFIMVSALEPYEKYSIEENVPKILNNGSVKFIKDIVDYCGPILSNIPTPRNCYFAISFGGDKISYSNVQGAEYKKLPMIKIIH